MSTLKEDFQELFKRLDRIERNIIGLKEPHEYPGDNTPQPYAGETKCSKCGMVFAGATSYYCSQNDCPTFMKATY